LTEPGKGRTLGILGGGQLGRFLALAARDLGWKTAALDPSADSPALQVVDTPMVGAVDDVDAAARLAGASDIVTLEWEMIALPVLEKVASLRPLHPSPSVLAFIQDRLVQRRFLAKHGFPQTEYAEANSPGDLPSHAVILKRRKHGYDGKGQARLDPPADLSKAAQVLMQPCIWEKIVPFQKEISVILARTKEGRTSVFPVAENIHRNGILLATRAPAEIPSPTARRATALALEVAQALGHVGVMAVEMFLLADGALLINEIAPRVHNSGHYTMGACTTSQFEQHVRAVCGLPFGETQGKPAVMVNLMGELWNNGEPDWDLLGRIPGLAIHLYGKSEARPRRKMGHYTVVGPAAAEEWRRADERLSALRG